MSATALAVMVAGTIATRRTGTIVTAALMRIAAIAIAEEMRIGGAVPLLLPNAVTNE